jgi:hypothetical protein
MSAMITNLEKLNRKERFFLIRTALGHDTLKLGQSFRDVLISKFHLNVPDDAFVATDYHLNWIFAAAALTFGQPVHDHIYDNRDGTVDGTQEDVDLLVAFEDDSGLNHLIMLEAKGVGAYDNKQFAHKMKRLTRIFGKDGCRFARVRPYFGLMSPREPRHLRCDVCPSWLKIDGKIPWLPMLIPERFVLFGCDERGRPDRKREYWTVSCERVSGSSPRE